MKGREAVAIVKKIINDYIDDKSFWGDLSVIAGSSWRKRGEIYGQGALAVILCDGSPMYEMLNYGEPNWNFHTLLNDKLAKAGLWFEPMYGWAIAIYED